MGKVVTKGTSSKDPGAPPRRRMRSTELVPLDRVRSRLTLVWMTGAIVSVILVVIQSIERFPRDKVQEAWAWLLPTIMPTLAMIVTALAFTALDPLRSKAVVRRGFFRLALWLSIVYLALVIMSILLGPVAAADGAGMIEFMHTSNLWLGPFQGLVASAIGVLFVTKQKQDADES